MVASTAAGDRAGGVAVGQTALPRSARRLGGLWVAGRFVYGIRAGRVRFVAVAARAELTRLRSDLRAAGI